jgi:hypothetical protein
MSEDVLPSLKEAFWLMKGDPHALVAEGLWATKGITENLRSQTVFMNLCEIMYPKFRDTAPGFCC